MAKVIILIILLINGIKTLDFESLEFKEITLTEENDIEFDIYPDETYKFISGREDYIYCFPEEFSYILNYSNNGILYPFPFEGEKIITYFNCLFQAINISANYYKNLKNSVKIKISSIPYYEKISSLETINEDKVFFMWNNETEKKLQYFYSLDNNCKIYSNFKYIGDDENGYFSSNEFIYPIRNLPIIIKFKVYNTCSIIMQTFLIDNISNEKNINDEEAFFSIFDEQTTSIINFEGNRMNKMITLFGPKFLLKNETFNPKLVIYKDGIEIATLNKSQKYYKLDNNYNGKLTLIGETNEGFFCIYSFLSEGKSEILDDISLSNYQLVGNSVYIKLKKLKEVSEFKLILIII